MLLLTDEQLAHIKDIARSIPWRPCPTYLECAAMLLIARPQFGKRELIGTMVTEYAE
jgi:hypothetical protein